MGNNKQTTKLRNDFYFVLNCCILIWVGGLAQPYAYTHNTYNPMSWVIIWTNIRQTCQCCGKSNESIIGHELNLHVASHTYVDQCWRHQRVNEHGSIRNSALQTLRLSKSFERNAKSSYESNSASRSGCSWPGSSVPCTANELTHRNLCYQPPGEARGLPSRGRLDLGVEA